MTLLLGISGSTSKESWNRAAARRSRARASRGPARDPDLHDVPNYNQDHDDQLGGTDTPEVALALWRRIEQADGLVLSSPEYNWSFTGVLKNALDRCSRPTVPFDPGRKADPAPWRLGRPRRDRPRPASPKTGAAVPQRRRC